MISKDEAKTLATIGTWTKTESSYIKNAIIHAAMNGDTAIHFEAVVPSESLIKELEELDYRVERIQNPSNTYRVYWDE